MYVDSLLSCLGGLVPAMQVGGLNIAQSSSALFFEDTVADFLLCLDCYMSSGNTVELLYTLGLGFPSSLPLQLISMVLCIYMKKHCHGGARQASDPWTAAVSSYIYIYIVNFHQQGIRRTCLAFHPALYKHGEP